MDAAAPQARLSRIERRLDLPYCLAFILAVHSSIHIILWTRLWGLMPEARLGLGVAVGTLASAAICLRTAPSMLQIGIRGQFRSILPTRLLLLILIFAGTAILQALTWRVIDQLGAVDASWAYASVFMGVAALAALLLSASRLTSPLKATILTVTLCGGLALTEGVWSHLEQDAATRPVWTRLATTHHDELGWKYAPHSATKAIYATNPRGYFEVEDVWGPLDMRGWSLLSAEGCRAKLSHAEGRDGPIALAFEHLIDGAEGWEIRLEYAGLHVVKGGRYRLRFQARADEPRRAGVVIRQLQPPWGLLSEFEGVQFSPQWREFDIVFEAEEDEPNAGLHFDLAQSGSTLELRDVSLTTDDGPNNQRFTVTYQFNDLGFRDKTHATRRDDGVFRIACLGDSYTLGEGVHARDVFTKQLEGLLNEPAPQAYEVLNFGVQGYNTSQERQCYELYAKEFDPDLVLVVMVENDNQERPTEDGELTKRFRVARAIRDFQYGNRQSGYANCMAQIRDWNKECLREGRRLAVVVFRHYEGGWLRMAEEVSAGLAEDGIPVLDLGDTLLRNHQVDELVVHPSDQHPNEVAHRLAAKAIYEFLSAKQLLQRERTGDTATVGSASASAEVASKP